jgi:hypothetical protein
MRRQRWGSVSLLGVIVVICAWPLTCVGASASPETPLAKTMALATDGAAGVAIVEAYVKQSPTFQFDGLAQTVRLESMRSLTACPGCYEYTLYFESQFPGYGDRAGRTLTPGRTPHRAKIVLAGATVVSGVLDDAWDMSRQMILDLE